MKRGTFLLSFIAFLLMMQFFRINQTNPAPSPSTDFASLSQIPPDKLAILKGACYDCHSNETRYPWYSQIAPISWRLSGHIKEGRKELNFSEWGTYSARKQEHRLEDIEEAFRTGSMPTWDYKLAHAGGRLSLSQRKEMEEWFKAN